MSPLADASFTPVRTRRLYQEICSQVRRRLAHGQLKPGDKLPPEREFAQELGVSRAAVREALRALENAGVVTMRPGSHGGAFIRQGDASSLTQPLGDLMALGQLSTEGLDETRAQVNAMTVRMACERRTEDDLAALARCVADAEDAPDARAAFQAQAAFLRRIAAATGNPLWPALVESLESLAAARAHAGAADPQLLDRVLRALERRQGGEARKAMQAVLRGRELARA